MSAKSQVLGLAQALANDQCDPQTIADYFEDVLQELNAQPWLTQATLLTSAEAQPVFNPPPAHVRTLSVIYDDRTLTRATLRELEWVDVQWRDRVGQPQAYVTDEQTTNTFRLYPLPDLPSQPYIFFLGAPLGRNYPTYSVVLIHTETRQTIPDWLDLPVALAVLARDFARESKYRDPAFAKACAGLSSLMLKWLA